MKKLNVIHTWTDDERDDDTKVQNIPSLLPELGEPMVPFQEDFANEDCHYDLIHYFERTSEFSLLGGSRGW